MSPFQIPLLYHVQDMYPETTEDIPGIYPFPIQVEYHVLDVYIYIYIYHEDLECLCFHGQYAEDMLELSLFPISLQYLVLVVYPCRNN